MTLPEAEKLITLPAGVLAAPGGIPDAPAKDPADISQTWADLGCGSGLFTKALQGQLPAGSTVYAVDSRRQSLSGPGLHFVQADFENDALPLPSLDGVIMANSLHYVKDKPSLLEKLKTYLKPGAVFILVEYDTTAANPWVPFPLDFTAAARLFPEAGFAVPEKIAERPSVYNRANLYSAWCRLL